MLAAILAASAATDARAEDGAARLIEEGIRLGKEQRFAAALERFREAVAQAPGAEGHCYVAMAYFRLGRLTQSHLHLGRAEASGRTPGWCTGELRRVLQDALDRARYVPVAFEVQPPGARVRLQSVEADEEVQSPTVLWLPRGEHAFWVHAPGHQPRSERVTVAGSVAAVRFALVPVAQPAPAPALDRAPPAAAAPAMAPPRGESTPAAASQPRTALWLSAVGSGVLLGAGLGVHLLALSTQSAAERAPEQPTYQAELGAFRTQRAAALGLYAAGATLGGLALYLTLRPTRERVLAATLSPSPDGLRMAVALSF